MAISDLVQLGVDREASNLAGMLGCKHGSLLIKYLGLPLNAKFKDVSSRDSVVE